MRMEQAERGGKAMGYGQSLSRPHSVQNGQARKDSWPRFLSVALPRLSKQATCLGAPWPPREADSNRRKA